MSFSVVNSVNHLVAEYRRFLLSTYRLADPRLREQFESHIKEGDVLVKGPYVTLANDFAREHTLKQLHEKGIGHKDLQRLNWSFGDSRLFRHQEQSLDRVDQLERNVIVKTGTGSGKTEAFLLPVMSGVLKMRAEGIKGTKAILLYSRSSFSAGTSPQPATAPARRLSFPTPLAGLRAQEGNMNERLAGQRKAFAPSLVRPLSRRRTRAGTRPGSGSGPPPRVCHLGSRFDPP